MVYGLGEKLRRLREMNRLYAKDIADKLHVSTTTIYQYESGGTQPTPDGLIKLAEIYHTTVDYLLGLHTPLAIIADDLTKQEIEAIEKLNESMKTILDS